MKRNHICFCKQDLFVHEDHLPCRKFRGQGGSCCETSTKLQQLLHQSFVPNCTNSPVVCTQLYQCTSRLYPTAPVHQRCLYRALHQCTSRVFIMISAPVHQSCVYHDLCNNAPMVCTQLQHGSNVFLVSSATALFCP